MSDTIMEATEEAEAESGSPSPEKEEAEAKKEPSRKTKAPPDDGTAKSDMRRNIKRIMNDTNLDAITINARKDEEDRIKRLAEAQQQYSLQLQQQMQQQLAAVATSSVASDVIFEPASVSLSNEELICLSSDDDDDQPPKNAPIVEILSDNEDLETVSSKVDTGGSIDTNNCGIHVDDNLNVVDGEGRVLINPFHPEEDPDVFLAPHLAQLIKPHQIGGLRFLYDNTIENTKKFKEPASGLGCILAHSMGLGKTFQIVSFTEIFLNAWKASGKSTRPGHVLCIVPINTLQNWLSEFEMWLPSTQKIEDSLYGISSYCRKFKVFALVSDCKTFQTRAKEILSWKKEGGVLLLGYEIYRMLAEPLKSGKKNHEGLDPDTLNELDVEIKKALVKPGPDLVVCDEGHRIKNAKASISRALKLIETPRRIVLTGYPLQNNLLEYWCMVDFVRPNFLGSEKEFSNMFEKPIKNGQCLDSTPSDRQLMRYRSHVLYTLLRGFVQRRSHSILKKTLPVKHEHVILLRMTEIQKRLMKSLYEFINNEPMSLTSSTKVNPIILFSVCNKIWNHPDILYNIVMEGQDLMDLDMGMDMNTTPTSNGKTPKTKKTAMKSTTALVSTSSFAYQFSALQNGAGPSSYHGPASYNGPAGVSTLAKDRTIDYEWAKPCFSDYVPSLASNSIKMLVMFEIIEKSLFLNERLLVFSQSLYTLDVIEKFLGEHRVPGYEAKWSRNANYFRLDGSTSSSDREKLVNRFNKDTSVHLFLLSTRAGCLGINLIGANRIIVFDASWNPCHDAQAACRIYRYGQQRECFIYRLVCDNSLEKKIYDRQVNKQGISHRIIDEMNTESTLTAREISSLIEDLSLVVEKPVREFSEEVIDGYSDDVIKHICAKHYHYLSKEPFEHESLLLDHKESKLSVTEKARARQNYQDAKNQSSAFKRSSIYNHGNFENSNLTSQMTPSLGGLSSTHFGSALAQQTCPNPLNALISQGFSASYVDMFSRLQRQGFSLHKMINLTTPLVLQDKNSLLTTSVPVEEGISVLKNPLTGTNILLTRDCKVVEMKSDAFSHQTSSLQQTHTNSLAASPYGHSVNHPNILRSRSEQLPRPLLPVKPTGPPELISLSDDDDDSVPTTNSTSTTAPDDTCLSSAEDTNIMMVDNNY